MRKRILAFALSLVMLLGLAVWQPAFAASSGTAGSQTAEHWFYNQLSAEAKAIYNALENAYKNSVLKTGTESVSLDGVIGSTAATDYLKGNRSLFNDFSAAKDAFDLEHPEAWYFDSAQLTLIAEATSATSAKASMGTGKSDTYYVMGVKSASEVDSMTAKLNAAVKTIVDGAQGKSKYEQIKYVHDQVVSSISYKYEIECKPGNAGFIRTAYALVTGEGVCEGYVRSFQMILNELGIPCVPIHGTQTTGTPEQHMWCAVYIADTEKGTGWYMVDPTWDDPIPSGGSSSSTGIDGGERDTYLMVGNDVIGSNWLPSGYVSTGTMEFRYPDIAPRSYGAGEISSNGLVVTYNDGLMEGTSATVYNISYNGMGVYKAAQKGYHLLVKLYDINADGSEEGFEDWYYLYNSLYILAGSPGVFDANNNLQNTGNQYHYDTGSYVVEAVSNCEYVEFAVTELAPRLLTEGYDALAYGYLKDSGGEESDIIAQTGLIYNPNGTYEQPPYAKNVTPKQNESTYVGATHTIHMEFTDPLFHPDADSIKKSAALGKVNEAETAVGEKITLDYTGMNFSWGVNGGLPHTFAQKPVPQNVRFYCAAHDAVHTDLDRIEAYGSACRLTTLEFEFTPSVMWADDSVAYQFYLTGLVGVKSNKKPVQAGMSFVFETESCFTYYRCPSRGGIDWNLWGQPQLLDDPNNLDFSKMTVEGTNGYQQSIAELYKNMNLDDHDMNGRLLLVVEDAGADKAKADTMSDLLESKMDVDLQKAVASALYEIDFARICGQTVVQTGQSLRMQVGFPAGFDASNLSTTVFKVYHFIKNAKGEITGVEEIPVTVTPYGLVFQVSSFSPFAIVAEETKTVDNSRSVVLVSDGNGTIEAVGYTPGANDVKGTVKLSSGNTYTIKITPKSGYALESITATGLTKEIECKGGTFTLSYSDIGDTNAMIGVTFVKEEKAPEKVEVLSLCGHTNVSSTGGKAATCTQDGVAPTVTCNDCKQVLSGGEVIHATGHVYEAGSNYKEPTCTQPGTKLSCKICKTVSQAPALGHEYINGACVRKVDGKVCGAKEPCIITFNPNGGQIVSGDGTFTVGANSALSKERWPVAARAGYVFSGWYMVPTPGEGDTAVSSLTVTRSIVLYAAWKLDTSEKEGLEIILNANGGTLHGGVFSVRTGADKKLAAMPGNPTREGYDFAGWFTSQEGGTQITLDTVFTGSATIYAHWKSNGSSGETSGSGGSGTTGKTETAKDGTVTTTVTDSITGTTTVTVTSPDGSVSVTVTDAAGDISRQESFANGVQVTTEIPLNGTVSASITIPEGMESVSVTIRAATAAGTVAVNRATGEIVMLSVPVDGGLKVVLDRSADIVLVDRSMDFDDMSDRHWAANSVDFVTAHNLFNGTGDDKFSPDAKMTRSMLMTVLARLDGVDTDSGSIWYEAGMEWAVAKEISDGTNPGADITREQLATMLYRYAGEPQVSGRVTGYPDANQISDWASLAMRWAVQNGIIQGADGYLNPGSKAARSEVATMMERFCRNVAIS